MYWATPRAGLRPKSSWFEPIIKLWAKVKPKEGKFRTIFPHVSNEWVIDYHRAGTFGVVQARINLLVKEFGATQAKLHSFRNWGPTCARQLRFPREEREVIGHWAPGSRMPDHYDKAVCATELKLREAMLAKLREGWRPSKDFEVQGDDTQPGAKAESSSDESTSVTSIPSVFDDSREDISNLWEDKPSMSLNWRDYV